MLAEEEPERIALPASARQMTRIGTVCRVVRDKSGADNQPENDQKGDARQTARILSIPTVRRLSVDAGLRVQRMRLLIGVRETKQSCFAPVWPEQLHSDGQAFG